MFRRELLCACVLINFVLSECVNNVRSENATNIRKKSIGFLVSLPNALVSGENATVCASIHGGKLPVHMLLELKWKERRYKTLKALDLESSCFELSIPQRKYPDPQFVGVKIQAQINGEIYSGHNQDPIVIYPNQKNKFLIETDRGVYRPGDVVKFVILQLDHKTLPIGTNVSDIKIKNPLGITVMAWDDEVPDHGLVKLEYQLVDEALTGKWKLQVQNQSRPFEVAKYNVPRFKIDLKYPKLVYYETDVVNVVVCGRYSYNKPVSGIAFVKISDSVNGNSVNKLNEMINGCSQFTLNRTEINIKSVHDRRGFLHITATITEYGTNKMDVTTGKIKIMSKPYSLKLQSPSVFIPGLPYKGQIALIHNYTRLEEESLELCYNLAIKKSWNYFNSEECQAYNVSNEGVVNFQLWPLKNSVIHVNIHVKSIKHPHITDKYLLVRLYSPSSSFIQLEKGVFQEQPCNAQHQYTVLYSTSHLKHGDNVTFYYTVKSATEIFQTGSYVHQVQKLSSVPAEDKNLYLGNEHKFVKMGTNIDRFTLNFEITKRFISKYELLVYTVNREGETVAATITSDIEPCSLQISSYWKENQLLPGSIATLNIKSATPALCAVSATDKASKFMSANHFSLSLDHVIKVFSSEREPPKSGRNSCIGSNKKSLGPSKAENMLNFTEHLATSRRKRHVYSFSEDFDAYDVFSRFGVVTITNLQIVTKPCYNGPLITEPNQVQSLTDHYDVSQEDTSSVTIRSFFPENWLWELIPVGNHIQFQRTVPHSITTWITNVFCVSESQGVGFARELELISFQSFFMEVLTPYSIKKGESFHLLVHVSNYVNYSFPIRISIRMSNNIELTHKMSATYCLKPNSTQTHNYPIRGVDIGVANVTVLVENESQYPFSCGPEIIVSKRDVVAKSFKVIPEGDFISTTRSALLCASHGHFINTVSWNLSVPRDIVPGTDKVVVSINGDLLGQTIENLDHLITIPTGCGEQIIASMAPNLYVLRYLQANGLLTAARKQQIIRNLKIGYQKILNYLHPDGSFSAFGYYDPSGSTFLTAFVVKILQESREFIYVDQRVLDRALDWIFAHQLENGCFDTMHHVFQDMGGTNIENSTAGLTSYVIASLFDAKLNIPEGVQQNTKFCIRAQRNPDKYSLVISSYALFKIRWLDEAKRFLQKTIAVANIEDNLMWWSVTSSEESYASDIEITSYALLALMEEPSAEYMAYAHSIVHWLVSKIGPTGAFKSTQDTVVALDALTKYANYIKTSNVNLHVHLQTHTETHEFSLSDRDRLMARQIPLSSLDSNELKVHLSGSGCAFIQSTTSYYTTNIPESEAFRLALEVSPVSNVDTCSIKSISPCIAYKGSDKFSNMAVMEVEIPSGFRADRASLYQLVESMENIKKFEEKDTQVNFYFTNLGANQLCFSFNVYENLPIEDRRDSLVKLYDYYRPERSLLQFYKIINNCSTDDGHLFHQIKPERTLNRSRRSGGCRRTKINSTNDNLNKDFVDLDVDMESPYCSYVPFYVLPPVMEQEKNQSIQFATGTERARHSVRGPHPLQPGG
ncbi:murinoglobulin-1-like [Anthonomus grandis grandis]|uniref:murinoglobulin-1-like n=1 Tax=Anthonomus grandis grandis TaxID=2921223 RepID=UPI0021665E6D|nr:murinoglobulin-1-like [Anthonomus grandis grandis]